MLKTKHRMSQIFVPGGFPQITYIPRTSHQLEARVRAAADYLCKLVVVTGATKSGKTVLVDKIFPTTSAIWINGGTISDEQSFWDSITESLSLFTSFEESSGNDYGGSLDGEAAAEGNVLCTLNFDTNSVSTGDLLYLVFEDVVYDGDPFVISQKTSITYNK